MDRAVIMEPKSSLFYIFGIQLFIATKIDFIKLF